MLRTRITAVVLSGALAILTIGIPAVAAGGTMTRLVDDDGHASPTNCDGPGLAYSQVQSAVDASDAGDTVIVCPGTYQEHVLIRRAKTGVTLRSVEDSGARILSPVDDPLDHGAILVEIRAQGVVVHGFRLVSLAREHDCFKQHAAVFVAPGASALVRNNRISTVGGASLGGCGYLMGVFAGGGGDTAAGSRGIPLPLARVNVVSNVIRDFQYGGVVASGNARANVRDNSMQYHHGDPASCHPSAGGAPSFGVAFLSTWASPYGTAFGNDVASSIDPDCDEALTVALHFGPPQFNPFGDEGGVNPPPTLGPTHVEGNTAADAWIGYQVHSMSDVTLLDNRGTRTYGGVVLAHATDSKVARHLQPAGSSHYGLYVTGASSGNRLRNSDVRGQEGPDCFDSTEGDGTGGTANTWTNVRGDDANVPGICIPGTVAP